MGGRLCIHVVNLGAVGKLNDLTKGARLVLFTMATVARDSPHSDPHTYWGGWEHLALSALGYPTYSRTAERAVARCVAELADAGLIERDPSATQHGRRVYLLTLPDPLT